jgi:hypothetical protein
VREDGEGQTGSGVPTAQALRKVFRLLDAEALQRGFAAWTAWLRAGAREGIPVDRKTLPGSKTSSDGKGAPHVVLRLRHRGGPRA